MRHAVGWSLFLIGLVWLGVFAFFATSYRFKNETLTETQLSLWALQRWLEWVPALAVAGVGLLLVQLPQKKSR